MRSLSSALRRSHKTSSSPWQDAVITIGGLGLLLLVAFALRQLCSHNRLQQLRGPLLAVLVAALWTASNVVIQIVYEKHRFPKPAFITAASFSAQSLYLLCYSKRIHTLLVDLLPACCFDPLGAATGPYRLADGTDPAFTVLDDEPLPVTRGLPPTSLSSEDILRIAVRLFLLMLSASAMFNASLEMSSVSIATLIASSSSLWSLLFARLILREPCTCARLACVALSMAGVALLVFGELDAHEKRRHGARLPLLRRSDLFANVLMLGSAVLYGLYAVILKRDVPSEKELPVPFLFGLIGLCSLWLALPLLTLLHVSHLERFSLPSPEAFTLIICNALFGTMLANMLLARATLLTSPTVVTVGLSLSIPMAMLSDVLRGRGHFNGLMLLGSVFTWIGFIGIASNARCCSAFCRAIGVTSETIRE